MGVSVDSENLIPLLQLDDGPVVWVEDVVNDGLCAGCGLCEPVSGGVYKMENIEEIGFRPVKVLADRPPLNVAPFCPGIFLERDTPKTEAHSESLWNEWGPVLEVWEGHAVDKNVRHQGSSGGVVTALGHFSVSKKMDLIGTIAGKSDPFVNEVGTQNDLADMSGSRYAPSSPARALSMQPEQNPTLFIGKPCDVSAYYNLNRLRPAHPESFSIGIFCAGVPSVAGNRRLVSEQGIDPSRISALKYRGEGWPGLWKAETLDGETREMTYADSWHYLQRFRQWRCYVCPDHAGEFADISVGDPWYKTNVSGEGRSLILVRTEMGRKILREAIGAGFVTAERLGDEKLPASQPGLLETRSTLVGRLFAMRLFGLTKVRFNSLCLQQAWSERHGLLSQLRVILATAKRLLRKGVVRW